MILLFQLIIITSILVMGYTIATQEHMAFYSVRKWAEKKEAEGKKWAMPIFICHWCQPSTFSIIAFIFAYQLGVIEKIEWQLLLIYILNVGGSSMLNGLLWGFNQKQNAEKEYYESAKVTQELMGDEIVGKFDENTNDNPELFEDLRN